MEIKFRGRRTKNREWVYGLPKYGSGGSICYICGWFGEDGAEEYDEIEVNTETVTQFTGWKDKNGIEIYKGDLISNSGSKILCEVIWQSHAGKWIMQSQGEGRGYYEMAYDYCQQHFEIVGNVFDQTSVIEQSNVHPIIADVLNQFGLTT